MKTIYIIVIVCIIFPGCQGLFDENLLSYSNPSDNNTRSNPINVAPFKKSSWFFDTDPKPESIKLKVTFEMIYQYVKTEHAGTEVMEQSDHRFFVYFDANSDLHWTLEAGDLIYLENPTRLTLAALVDGETVILNEASVEGADNVIYRYPEHTGYIGYDSAVINGELVLVGYENGYREIDTNVHHYFDTPNPRRSAGLFSPYQTLALAKRFHLSDLSYAGKRTASRYGYQVYRKITKWNWWAVVGGALANIKLMEINNDIYTGMHSVHVASAASVHDFGPGEFYFPYGEVSGQVGLFVAEYLSNDIYIDFITGQTDPAWIISDELIDGGFYVNFSFTEYFAPQMQFHGILNMPSGAKLSGHSSGVITSRMVCDYTYAHHPCEEQETQINSVSKTPDILRMTADGFKDLRKCFGNGRELTCHEPGRGSYQHKNSHLVAHPGNPDVYYSIGTAFGDVPAHRNTDKYGTYANTIVLQKYQGDELIKTIFINPESYPWIFGNGGIASLANVNIHDVHIQEQSSGGVWLYIAGEVDSVSKRRGFLVQHHIGGDVYGADRPVNARAMDYGSFGMFVKKSGVNKIVSDGDSIYFAGYRSGIEVNNGLSHALFRNTRGYVRKYHADGPHLYPQWKKEIYDPSCEAIAHQLDGCATNPTTAVLDRDGNLLLFASKSTVSYPKFDATSFSEKMHESVLQILHLDSESGDQGLSVEIDLGLPQYHTVNINKTHFVGGKLYFTGYEENPSLTPQNQYEGTLLDKKGYVSPSTKAPIIGALNSF